MLLLGALWGEPSLDGRHKWIKYLLLLLYLPFLALLNRKRLPWAIGGLAVTYGLVLFVGVYQWIAENKQGVSAFGLSYSVFSAILGIGTILSVYFACHNRDSLIRASLLVFALMLFFLQFQQGARGFLLATLLTLLILASHYFWSNLRRFTGLVLALAAMAGLFAYTSPIMQDRWELVQQDIAKIQQADYSSSIGYRLAMWDVGIHGILQQPWWGHGTGAPKSYFNRTVQHYKNGIYKDLSDFHPYAHYHNDWIEIGMHLGVPGILSLMYLLWTWYATFRRSGVALLGVGMISFVFLSGLTETFMVFNSIPVLLLFITAITVTVCWQKKHE
ncbi:MAG: O-antigen ligase family protein [Nitrosomonas sp.]|nr:O-antigen ligase family protein [Nitrosomonas sp.]